MVKFVTESAKQMICWLWARLWFQVWMCICRGKIGCMVRLPSFEFHKKHQINSYYITFGPRSGSNLSPSATDTLLL